MHFAEGGKMFIKNVELADCNQQATMCMRMLEERSCWTCIELAREVGIAPGTKLHIPYLRRTKQKWKGGTERHLPKTDDWCRLVRR